MDTVRKELLPGVWLTALRSGKFKTDCLSVTLLTQLDRETAAMNAVPLCCGAAAAIARICRRLPSSLTGSTAAG